MAAPIDCAPVKVALLALPVTTPASLYALHEVFSAVGVAWEALTGEASSARTMDTRILALVEQPFASPTGAPIAPHAGLAEIDYDLVVVTDLALPTSSDLRGRWPAESAWLRRRFERGATVCSVCTGSVLLAEAGLLDGLEATTHWAAADLMRTNYPQVRLQPQRILCPAGPGHRIVTGGGPGSWEDMALHLIARFCGEAEAVRIAKIFVLGDRSAGQLPFTALGRPRSHSDAVVGDCQAWIADHYADPHPVARMVDRSGLPERTFKRRFKAATGYAPVNYVQALRMEEAKQLLERTRETTETIGAAVGYADPAFFRRLFKRRTGITPAEYRRRFAFLAADAPRQRRR